MPLYDYCCPHGHLFERMAAIADRAQQTCPACGQVSDKIPSRISLGGQASPGRSADMMPQTWRGTYEGNPEYTGQLRRQWDAVLGRCNAGESAGAVSDRDGNCGGVSRLGRRIRRGAREHVHALARAAHGAHDRGRAAAGVKPRVKSGGLTW